MDFPQQYGKYTLLKRLAAGGMAEIFLARQAGLGGFEKDVVVKRLLPEHAQNSHLVDMFLDEARIAANLTHPNIAQIYDLGRQDEFFFIAMEYVRGVDLRRACSQGIAEGNYLPLQHAVRIIAEVCDALSYAHVRTDPQGRPLGIVHRDVSPTNILLTFEGSVKLVDFGIAKAESQLAADRKGQIKGKIGYMSPEQVRGEDLDARSDLFAAGINLYEITLGRRLFRGESEAEAMAAVERCDFPRPRAVEAEYPESLERIVLRALAADPIGRYSTARSIRRDLEDFLAEAGLRSTAGMLAEYLKSLFREQLEIEAREGTALRRLAKTMEVGRGRDTLGNLMPPQFGIGAADLMGVGDTMVAPVPDPVLGGAGVEAPLMAVAGSFEAVDDGPTVEAATLVHMSDTDVDATVPMSTPTAAFEQLAAENNALISAPRSPVPAASVRTRHPAPSINQLPSIERAAAQSSGSATSAPLASAEETYDSAEESIELRKPRSYAGLIALLIILPAGYGLYWVMTREIEGSRPSSTINFEPPRMGETTRVDPDELPPPERQKRAILRLESEPPGARVIVNGNVLNGVTPTSVQTFANETSTVRMLLPGHRPVEDRIVVSEDGSDAKLTLEKGRPEFGTLRVETAPSGVNVLINGNEVGVSPLKIGRVAAQTEIVVRLERDGFYPHVALLAVRKGEEREIGVRLVPDSGPRKLSAVNVESIPAGARIYDVSGGKTPKFIGRTGKYPLKMHEKPDTGLRLRAEADEREPVEVDIDVREPFYTVFLRLPEPEKFYGNLSVIGTARMTVYVGTSEIGRTPIRKHRLPEGEHIVIVVDEDSQARSEFSVVVNKDQTVEKAILLEDGKLVIR